MKRFSWMFVGLLFLVTGALHAEDLYEKGDCKDLPGGLKGNYCVYKTKGKNKDILYYLHGSGLNREVWTAKFRYPQLIQKRWSELKFDAPTVVAISMTPFWLLVDENKAPQSGLYKKFVDEAMPALEKLYDLTGDRYVMGESMGGFNASQLLLRAPEKFKRFAILCPAIVDMSPYDEQKKVDDFITRTGADKAKVAQITFLSKLFIDEETWAKVSPLVQAPDKLKKEGPELYLSCSLDDEYGFYEGTLKFADIARKNGVKLTWYELAGRHCAVDTKSVAEFFAKKKD